MITWTSVLLFLLVVHTITSLVAIVIAQICGSGRDVMNENFRKDEIGLRVACRIITVILCVIMCAVVLPFPYLVVIGFFNGGLDSKVEKMTYELGHGRFPKDK